MEILRDYGDYLAFGLVLAFTALIVSIPVICQRAGVPYPAGGHRRE